MDSRYSLAVASAVLATVSAAQAAYLANGDFETLGSGSPATQTFDKWLENGDVASVAAVGITGQSARLQKQGGTNSLYQTPTDSAQLSKFIYTFDFASSDPGDEATFPRTLNINLRPGTASPTVGQINLRVVDLDSDNDGDIQAYNGTAWVNVLKDAVLFSSSDTSLASNHLEIVGDLALKTYSLNVNGSEASGLAAFHGAVPANATLQQVTFETGNLAAGAFYVVDNVTLVPEPAALGVMALGVGLLGRRRKA